MNALRKPSPIVQLPAQTHQKLVEIAREDDIPIGDVVTYLVDRYERERFWTKVREEYARLKADPVAWNDYLKEVELWDQLANDGLHDEDPYYTPDEEREILANARHARTEGR